MTIDPADFTFIRQLVRDRAAIVLDESKEYLVRARLTPLARREGLDSVGDLIARARRGDAAAEDEIVAAIATKETSFFRDAHPFEALRSTIIPELLANRTQRLRFWSGAASTGQEAYSLALLMQQDFPEYPTPRILGTDFAEDAVAQARAGRYSQLEVNRGLPAALLIRNFERDGLAWVLKPSIREVVEFRRLNLLHPWQGVGPMDLVLLRNVLIYFEMETRQQILDRLAVTIRPGGYLLLGSSESTHGLRTPFQQVTVGKTVVYQNPTDEG